MDVQQFELPKGKHKPKTSLRDYLFMIYGPPKTGKTTFANGWDNALFLATEPGTAAMEAADITIPSWEVFTEVVYKLQKDARADAFDTIVIDTVDLLWEFLSADVCARKGWDDLNDPGFGYGYRVARNELHAMMGVLRTLNKAIILISHERKVSDFDEKGRRFGVTTVTSDLPNSARKVLHGYADFILRAEVLEDGSRVLRTRPFESPDLQIECGCRGDINRPMPEFIPLDFKTFKKEFVKAFRQKKAAKAKAPAQAPAQQEAQA
jgi:hypothetical protein